MREPLGWPYTAPDPDPLDSDGTFQPPARAAADEPGIAGPHCSHDECGFGECDASGLVEHPCRKPGCPLCGGPAANTPEQWASVASQVALMTPEDQARVADYLDKYPLVRRGPDDDDSRLAGVELSD